MRRNANFLLALIVLALSAALAFAWLLWKDPDRFRPQLAALLSEAAGVPVAVQGPMRWFWQPTLALAVSKVSLHAPSMSVRIERLEVEASTVGLLRGDLRIRRLLAADVTLDLTTMHAAQTSGALFDPSQLPLDRLQIEHLRLQRDGVPWFAIEQLVFDDTARDTPIPAEMRLHAGLSAKMSMQLDGDHIRLRDLVLHTPAGEVRGMLDVELMASPPRLRGKLRAERLAITSAQRGRSSGPFIPRVALDLSALRLFDADIEVAVGALAIDALQLQDVLLPVSLQQGQLHLTATARFGGGFVTLDSDVRADDQHWASRLDLDKANAGQVLGQLGLHQVRDGGLVNLQAELDADGAHVDALLHSLRGDVSLRLSNVSIDAGVSQLIGADVLVALLEVLRGGESESIKLRCAVADFKVRDGVLRSAETIGAQTAVANLLGGGVIALPQERMDLIIRPWPRHGVGLSATALSGAVAISGPLLHPDVTLTDEAIWRTGASVGAAVLTGGLSLIAQGLLERARGDTPCEQAMGRQKVERGSEDVAKSVSEGTKGVAESVGRGVDSVANKLRDSVQGLGQGLKGLFEDGAAKPRPQRRETQ